MTAHTKKKQRTIQQARAVALKPEAILCSECQNIITAIVEIRSGTVKKLPGMNYVFTGICSRCGHKEWSYIGSPSAIEIAKTFQQLVELTDTYPTFTTASVK